MNEMHWEKCHTNKMLYVCQRMLFGLKRIKLRPFRATKANDSGKTTLKSNETKNQKNNFGLRSVTGMVNAKYLNSNELHKKKMRRKKAPNR